nr:hypothetical protein GCM10025732_45040 [Glycomyces mayteni]
MVRHLAEHFREPLTVADVAAAARLHPNYAMTHFRKIVRTTVIDYLTRCRLAEDAACSSPPTCPSPRSRRTRASPRSAASTPRSRTNAASRPPSTAASTGGRP